MKSGLHKFNYGNPAIVVAGSRIFDAVVFFLFLAKPIQRWRIHRMPLSTGICVTVLISKIFALALSCPKNTAFFIFSLCGHCQISFRCGKSLN